MYMQRERDLCEKAAEMFAKEIGIRKPKINYCRRSDFVGYSFSYHRVIRVSLFMADRMADSELITTVQHELMHLKNRKHGHGPEFQELCKRYGVDGREYDPAILPWYLEWTYLIAEA